MSIYDGVVTVDEDDVQVILGMDDDKIRLSAGGLEIGEWPADDCSIDPVGNGVFTITAENETLTFVPNNPTTFSAAMNVERVPVQEPDRPRVPSEEISNDKSKLKDDIPNANSLTMAAFYALAAITAVLGVWALVTIVL